MQPWPRQSKTEQNAAERLSNTNDIVHIAIGICNIIINCYVCKEWATSI